MNLLTWQFCFCTWTLSNSLKIFSWRYSEKGWGTSHLKKQITNNSWCLQSFSLMENIYHRHKLLLKNKVVQWVGTDLRPPTFIILCPNNTWQLSGYHDCPWLNFSNAGRINIAPISRNSLYWIQLRPVSPVFYVASNQINTKWFSKCLVSACCVLDIRVGITTWGTQTVYPAKNLPPKHMGFKHQLFLYHLQHFGHIYMLCVQ